MPRRPYRLGLLVALQCPSARPRSPHSARLQQAGSLYSTAKDELKLSLQHHSEGAPARDFFGTAGQAAGGTAERESHFCSKVVTAFYQHMGWMSVDRPPASVMPADFDQCNAPGCKLARPVELLGGASFEPLEVLWSPQSGVQLPVKFRKANRR